MGLDGLSHFNAFSYWRWFTERERARHSRTPIQHRRAYVRASVGRFLDQHKLHGDPLLAKYRWREAESQLSRDLDAGIWPDYELPWPSDG
jgi:hypothetical protein